MRKKAIRRFEYHFVDSVPKALEAGVLYVSIDFSTALHLCACGCGNKVITPISPSQWQMTFNGEGISLYPSIGNWSFDCQSHYWIEFNNVRWSRRWSSEEINMARRLDKNPWYVVKHIFRKR